MSKIWFLAMVLFTAFSISGQTSRGTVTGVVTDSNGAIVPNANIELKQLSTNQTRTATSNNEGIYRFDAVDLGVYEVTISTSGFKTLVRKNVEIQANRVVTIDGKLEVGTDTVTVEVESSSSDLLQIGDTTRGGNIVARDIAKLPSAGLNPYTLARTLPGVTTATGSGAEFGNSAQFSINGQRPRGNNYLVDGVENNDISVTGPSIVNSNEDAVQEVSIQTGLFSAEFGRAGGGVFNTITKSGTNQFHGTGKWLYLSQAFNANSSSNFNSGVLRPAVFTENIFGGTLGGPVYFPNFGEGVPPIYNGKDRTFFFVGYQGDRYRSTANTSFRVPTANGFATLRNLFPAGTNTNVDTYLRAIGAARGVATLSNIALGRGPIGDGTIVADRGSVETGLFPYTYTSASNNRQYVVRIDHAINESQRLSFRYNDDYGISNPSGVSSPDFIYNFEGPTKNFLVTHNYVINNGLTNEFRFSFGRIGYNFLIADGYSTLSNTLPQISIAGISAIGVASNIPQGRNADNYLFQDTATKILGAHTLRFGIEILKQNASQRAPFNSRGTFSFTNGGTYVNASGGNSTYTALANYIDNFSGPTGNAAINFGDAAYDPSLLRQSYFVQDNWKVSQTLALNLGVRYENFGQPANNAFVYPAFAGFDPANFLVPNSVKVDNNNFGPIVGLTYSPSFNSGIGGFLFGDRKGVIRTGYQISYDTFFNNLLSNIKADAPNAAAATTVAPSSGRGSSGFYPTAIPTVPRTPLVTDQQTSVFNPNIVSPSTQKFSLGFQRELPSNFFMDVSYVGSLGRNLLLTEDLNPILLSTNARRFPALGIRRYRTSGANSSYNSLQTKLDKRFSQGLRMTAAYTWSKYLDSTSEVFATTSSNAATASIPAYLGGLALDWGPSDYDRPHRFVVSYVYTIPGPKSGFLKQILGGWEASGIYSLQSGAPFTLINGLDRNGDGLAGADRPDVGNSNAPRNTRAVIDTSCSTGYRNPDSTSCVSRTDVYAVQVAANTGTPGAAAFGRNTERSNMVNNFDMSFFKTFAVRENLKLEYRVETFNTFNHPQFTNIPGHNITSTLSGQFLNYALTNGGARNLRMGLKILF
jgi:Carboxypeptidase regulatory-like domain/TonB-dependent Receptor Plug Domain